MPSSNSASTEPGSDNVPSKIKVAMGPPQNSSFLVGPPLSKEEEGADQRQSAVKGRRPNDGQKTEEESDPPSIPKELEDVPTEIEARLKAAIQGFMAKGHAALSPETKRAERSQSWAE